VQGQYFDKKQWDGAALPNWAAAKNLLPEPVLEGEEDAIAAYWRAWELALRSVQQPGPASGFVSNYMYMEFSDCIFAHDTAIMIMFGLYGGRVFRAVESLDNFYARQHETGEICREIKRKSGADMWPNEFGDPMHIVTTQGGHEHYWWTRPTVNTHPPSHVSMDGLNDPSCMAWAEMASFRQTGSLERIRRVLPAQRKWHEAFQVYVRDANGFYITDWASVDNHPRNEYLGYGVDVACQAAHLARLIAEMCRLTGDDAGARHFDSEAETLGGLIRDHMWDEETGFFYDLDKDGKRMSIKSVLGFCPLLAGVATPEQAERLAAHLEDRATFNRPVRVPSLPATEQSYVPRGNYFHGGVWPFTNQMVVRGLEQYGMNGLAREIALNYWAAAVQTFRDTGTVWEYLAPESPEPGRSADPSNPGHNARPDFAGWGALAPIAYLLEYAIGLAPDALRNTVTWDLARTGACGCRRYSFGDVVADMLVEARTSQEDEPVLHVATNKPFTLDLRWGRGHTKSIQASP